MVLPQTGIPQVGVFHSTARLGQVGGVHDGASGQPQLPIVRFSRSDHAARGESVAMVLLQSCDVVGHAATFA